MSRPIFFAAISAAATFWVIASMQALPVSADTTPSNTNNTTSQTVEGTDTSAKPKIAQYVVQRGDYLDKIAKQHNINWPSIFELNESIANPDIIYPEQSLDIPEEDVPLTRTLPQETTLQVPDTYQPKAAKTRTSAPTTSKVASSRTTLPTPIAYTQQGKHMGVGSALAYVGYPYRYGGSSPAGFDCSGFTQYIAAQQGISLPRTVMGQFSATQRIAKGRLEPGDLVFFNAHHVAIYIGGGQVVHAATPALGVRVDSLESMIAYNGYLGAGRI